MIPYFQIHVYNAPVFALNSLKKNLFLLKSLFTTPFVMIYNYISMCVCKRQIYIIKKIIIMYMCTCIKVIAQKQTNQAMQILVVYVSYWQCLICRVQKINRDYYSIQLIIYSSIEFVFSNSTLINPRESELLFSAVF